MAITRLPNNPIIRPHMDSRMGANINGPSPIRVPEWLPRPLGRYYLYFAHHDGDYIRLAYADAVAGPWRMYEPGVLPLARSGFRGHIASPDVHVDHERREIRMYFHGSETPTAGGAPQFTRVALARDGLNFLALPEVLGPAYFRAFSCAGYTFALAMPGQLLRSTDGLTPFEAGPTLFSKEMRHSALLRDGDTLTVFYSNAGDCPERILRATIRLTPDWHTWRPTAPEVVLEPEFPWEGVHEPLEPSRRGMAAGPVRQLRDPAILQDEGRTYLFYSVAGESGIAMAEIA